MKLFRVVPKSGSPLERFLRAMALVAVFAGVLWAFEARFSRIADRFAANQTVYDETGTLSAEDRDFLRRTAEELKVRFGIELVVRVFREALVVPDLNEKTVFIGVSLEEREVEVVLPPLAASALGPEFADVVKRDVLGEALDRGQCQKGLVAAVVFLEQELSGLDTGVRHGRED